MSQIAKQVYTSIPPTADSNYWMLTLNEAKLQIYKPIDTERHRALLIKQRQQKPILKMATKEWRKSLNGTSNS